jgi:probable O-glycosylation ligase (exosortase A-associated)
VPIRDLFLTGIMFGLLPVCFRTPWIGMLVWSWIGYMNPHKQTWGFARDLPFALLVAIAILIGLLFSKDPERRPIPWRRETILLAALWFWFLVTTIFAIYPEDAWMQLEKVSKILLFIFITLKLFQTRERLRWLFVVIALSIGYYGLKGGFFVLRTGGAFNVQGPEDTFLGSNTDLGLALTVTLPFLLMLTRDETRPWLRRTFLVLFGFSILATVFTYSRGAMLAMPLVLAMLLLRARRRVLGFAAIAAVALFVWYFAPEEWFARMQTITNYEEDASAQGRLVSWGVAWNLALDRPLGGGFWAVPRPETFAQYAPEYTGVHSAHSIYFGVLGDHGFVGLALFLALLFSCLVTLGSLRYRLRRVPDAKWLVDYAQMVQISLVGYMVGGAFLTKAYWDLSFHLMIFAPLLVTIAERQGFLRKRTVPAPVVRRRARDGSLPRPGIA